MLSGTLAEGKTRIANESYAGDGYKKKKKIRIKNTYRNGIETSEIEWPFFGHFDNVALERYFVVAIGGVLWRDAVILQHLLK